MMERNGKNHSDNFVLLTNTKSTPAAVRKWIEHLLCMRINALWVDRGDFETHRLQTHLTDSAYSPGELLFLNK